MADIDILAFPILYMQSLTSGNAVDRNDSRLGAVISFH